MIPYATDTGCHVGGDVSGVDHRADGYGAGRRAVLGAWTPGGVASTSGVRGAVLTAGPIGMVGY